MAYLFNYRRKLEVLILFFMVLFGFAAIGASTRKNVGLTQTLAARCLTHRACRSPFPAISFVQTMSGSAG
jgi:hypothetical protein